MTILHIDSAITGEASASRELTAAIVRELTAADPAARVIYRDLAAEPLPHLTLPAFGEADSQAALAEFKAADTVVNGLRDIVPALGSSKNFHRLRIGIDHPGHASKVSGYVLSQPSQVDRTRIDACIDEAIAALPLLLDGDATKAMTRLHSFSAA